MHKQPTPILTHSPQCYISSVRNNGLVVGVSLSDGGRLWMTKVKRRPWRRQRKFDLTVWSRWFYKCLGLLLQVFCPCVSVIASVCVCVCSNVCVLNRWWVMSCCPVGRQKVKRRRCLFFHQVAIVTMRLGAAIIITTQRLTVTLPAAYVSLTPSN